MLDGVTNSLYVEAQPHKLLGYLYFHQHIFYFFS